MPFGFIAPKTFSETDTIKILEFLIDNIFVVFQVSIPMGTNYTPLLTDVIQRLLKTRGSVG
jgi:hypothetical protein